MEGISGDQLVKAAALLGAALCMGMGTIGAGIGEGYTGGKAVEAIGKRPDEAGVITRTMIIGQAITETTSIYALVVALILIFVV